MLTIANDSKNNMWVIFGNQWLRLFESPAYDVIKSHIEATLAAGIRCVCGYQIRRDNDKQYYSITLPEKHPASIIVPVVWYEDRYGNFYYRMNVNGSNMAKELSTKDQVRNISATTKTAAINACYCGMLLDSSVCSPFMKLIVEFNGKKLTGGDVYVDYTG